MADDLASGDATTTDTHDRGERVLLAALIVGLRSRSRQWIESAPMIDAAAFGQMMRTELLGGHTQAAFLGRTLAGSALPLSDADRMFAQSVMDEQEVFLAGFIADLEAGRYTDDLGADTAAVAHRAAMYADALLGTANQAWAEMHEAETQIQWLLGSGDNCADCPDIAAGSPYTRDTLPTYPGAGDTACRGNCMCTLEALSVRAFSRADQDDLDG